MRTVAPVVTRRSPAAAPRTAPPVRAPARSAVRPLAAAGPLVTLGSTLLRRAGGAPLVPQVRQRLEKSFGADLSAVRVHTDSRAQSAARSLSARAFTYGPDIFLGSGERPADLPLMAHESAHVLQQQRLPALQRWSSQETNRHEVEAHRASLAAMSGERFAVAEQVTGPRVQRLGISDAYDYFADKANLIMGFRLFTIILGINPINQRRVERSAANILRAMVEFLPGGTLISDALANHGVFDKVGAWVEQQLQTLGLVGGQIREALVTFVGTLSLGDVLDLGTAWSRAKRIFSEPIDQLLSFAKGLAKDIIKFIKDAILIPLAKLAQGTSGWDLLIAVLGKNPISNEVVPRTPENLIGGFMKLIGEEQVWENMKQANAVSRAWAWFQGALATVVGFVSQVPQLFLAALASLDVADIVLVPQAFAKVALVFAGFAVKFVTWAGEAVWKLLEIVFESLKPGALVYLKKTGAALKSILKNPLPFMGYLIQAAKRGFQGFADRFGTHFKAALLSWLTGSMPGVYIPKSFALKEIVKFVFSILGLSWQNVRAKLVKVLGEGAVSALETGFELVKTLITEGPAAAWQQIQESLVALKDQAISGIVQMVTQLIATQAIPKLLAMFIPGAGFIPAAVAIYDTIMVFVQKISQMMEVVKSFIDSIVAIAGGAIDAAASRVEGILARLMSLAISFLMGFAGLGKVADKVLAVIHKLQALVDKGLDKLVDWIVKAAKRILDSFGKDKKAGADQKGNTVRDMDAPITFGTERHTIRVHMAGRKAVILMASGPFKPISEQFRHLRTEYQVHLKNISAEALVPEFGRRIDALIRQIEEEEATVSKQLQQAPQAQVLKHETKRIAEKFRQPNEEMFTQMLGQYAEKFFGDGLKLQPGDSIVDIRPAVHRPMIVTQVKQIRPIGSSGFSDLVFLAKDCTENSRSIYPYRTLKTWYAISPKPHFESFSAVNPQRRGGRVVIDKPHLNDGSRNSSYKPPFFKQTLAGRYYAVRGHVVACTFTGTGGEENIVALTTSANEAMRTTVEVPLNKKIKKDRIYEYKAFAIPDGSYEANPVRGIEISWLQKYPVSGDLDKGTITIVNS